MREYPKPLEKQHAQAFRMCPISSVRAFALMMAPVYVHMTLNDKFVKVKSALDFFTEAELTRLKPFGMFYFPQEVDVALRFRKAASEVRELLSFDANVIRYHGLRERSLSGGTIGKEQVPLNLASFELSDAVTRLVGKLWSPGPAIDPYFVASFVNELCDLLPADLLKKCHEQSVVDYEKAVILSSWVVFLALHLGYMNLEFLKSLRVKILQGSMVGNWRLLTSPEMRELAQMAQGSLGQDISAAPGNLIRLNSLVLTRSGVASEKISSRIQRIERLAHV